MVHRPVHRNRILAVPVKAEVHPTISLWRGLRQSELQPHTASKLPVLTCSLPANQGLWSPL